MFVLCLVINGDDNEFKYDKIEICSLSASCGFLQEFKGERIH